MLHREVTLPMILRNIQIMYQNRCFESYKAFDLDIFLQRISTQWYIIRLAMLAELSFLPLSESQKRIIGGHKGVDGLKIRPSIILVSRAKILTFLGFSPLTV